MSIRRYRAPQHKPCPFCGAEPGLIVRRGNYWLAGCDSDDCWINPQVGSSESAEAAWADWDRRAA